MRNNTHSFCLSMFVVRSPKVPGAVATGLAFQGKAAPVGSSTTFLRPSTVMG